jgi:hypothetical protein
MMLRDLALVLVLRQLLLLRVPLLSLFTRRPPTSLQMKSAMMVKLVLIQWQMPLHVKLTAIRSTTVSLLCTGNRTFASFTQRVTLLLLEMVA